MANPNINVEGRPTTFKKGDPHTIESARKGGAAYAKTTMFRAALYDQLDTTVNDADGRTKAFAIMETLVAMAMEGDIKAIGEIARICGFYAPTQVESKNENLNNVAFDVKRLTTDQALTIRNILTSSISN